MFDDTLLVGDHTSSLVFPAPGVPTEQSRILYRGEFHGECDGVERSDRFLRQEGQTRPQQCGVHRHGNVVGTFRAEGEYWYDGSDRERERERPGYGRGERTGAGARLVSLSEAPGAAGTEAVPPDWSLRTQRLHLEGWINVSRVGVVASPFLWDENGFSVLTVLHQNTPTAVKSAMRRRPSVLTD